MKKKFDKYIAQSSKGQMIALAITFLVLVVIGGFLGRFIAGAENPDNMAGFGRPELWGFMQCVDAGFMQTTIMNNTSLANGELVSPASFPVILVSVAFCFCGMILLSFFTGVATEFLNSRREKILAGDVDYSFSQKYILIVGYDFQVKNLVRKLLQEWDRHAIVMITDSPVESIHEEILPELDEGDAKRLYIMRKDVTTSEAYADLTLVGAEEIYLIGDGDAIGRDGKTLQALGLLAEKAHAEAQKIACGQVKVYMHIEDSVLYSQVRSMRLPADMLEIAPKVPVFDLEIFNYYESWAWECWAHKDSAEGADVYLPLRHIRGSKHAELFIIGAGRMGRAMVNFAMPLMNYGGEGKHCCITVFDPDGMKQGFFPDRETLDALPETTVRFVEIDASSDEANRIMLEAAKRPETSVTVVVALSDPDAAIRAYAELSNRLRRENVSVLVWQATHSLHCPCKDYLKMGGPDSLADKTTLRYFGMTDKLPWKNTERFDFGMTVNYFYECWFPYGKEYPQSPKAGDADFVSTARSMWNGAEPARSTTGDVVAGEIWSKVQRWKKWSSVNSGDTFKEKASLFMDVPYEQGAETMLRAEHNRWWTEKLLSGWTYDPKVITSDESHADKPNMLHGDMVPFEDLSDVVKDKDKINLAALAVWDFI